MKEWALQNRKIIPADDLTVIIVEVENHAVSIKAGNIFPVTYSLLVNVSHCP